MAMPLAKNRIPRRARNVRNPWVTLRFSKLFYHVERWTVRAWCTLNQKVRQ